MPVIRIFYLFGWTLSSRACQKIHKNRFSVNCLLAFTGRSDRYLRKTNFIKILFWFDDNFYYNYFIAMRKN